MRRKLLIVGGVLLGTAVLGIAAVLVFLIPTDTDSSYPAVVTENTPGETPRPLRTARD
ncbi:hypothetical protein GCM10010123_37300 [Pilimelia anulata]|uniref:Uncharacterized protein n=1 Tax=Pilimelia anulata TaxID=53371 RepID=A0A8J3BC08_9ACTN|nr:hypothetical protein [Pilimelia anulata]GGK03876.1 hypothetical protein GCM10010123_37300 [Pilimelia anulata]